MANVQVMRNPGSRKSPKLLSSTLHLHTHIYHYGVKHFTDSPLRALSPGVWKHPSSELVPQHTNTVRKHWPEPEEVKAKAWRGAGGSGAAAGPARHPRAAQPRLRTRTRTPPSWHGAVQRCWAWPGLLTSQLGCWPQANRVKHTDVPQMSSSMARSYLKLSCNLCLLFSRGGLSQDQLLDMTRSAIASTTLAFVNILRNWSSST